MVNDEHPDRVRLQAAARRRSRAGSTANTARRRDRAWAYGRVVPTGVELGLQAAARGEWQRARELFEGVLGHDDAGGVLEELGWAGWWLADERLTLRARERAYRCYRAAGDAAGAGRVATWLAADFREFRGDDALARGWLERAHRLLDVLPLSADHGWLALMDADLALNLDRDDRAALAPARDGARIGRRLGDPDVEVVGLGLEGLALVGLGDVDDGMRRLDLALGRPTDL